MINKRNFICMLSSAVVCYPANTYSAFFPKKPKNIGVIPESWVELRGEDVLRYGEFILDLKLDHITPRMVIAPHFKSRRGVTNELPPKKMWKNIAPTLKAIDKICKETGISVKEILSAYRSPKYNRAVHGNRGSFHMQNQAIDLRFNNLSSWKASKVVKNYRDNKKIFKGGVGLYSSFIHIDTRGENQNW